MDQPHRPTRKRPEPTTPRATEPTLLAPSPTPQPTSEPAPRPHTTDRTELRRTDEGTTRQPSPARSLPQRDLTDEREHQARRRAALRAELEQRFQIERTLPRVGPVPVGRADYRFRGDLSRVAFTETVNQIRTHVNSPVVAKAMVDSAESRGWRGMRVHGSEDFRRMVGAEAAARGIKAVGFTRPQREHDLTRGTTGTEVTRG